MFTGSPGAVLLIYWFCLVHRNLVNPPVRGLGSSRWALAARLLGVASPCVVPPPDKAGTPPWGTGRATGEIDLLVRDAVRG